MLCFRFSLFLISIHLKWSEEVKVNMQGSLSLGKDVAETISQFIQWNSLSGRRQMDNGEVETNVEEDRHSNDDIVALVVNSAFLCRDFEFCSGEVRTIMNNYIITLTKSIESVFQVLIEDIDSNAKGNSSQVFLFEDDLKSLLHDIRKLLRNANEKITELNVAYVWIDLLKRISAKFQERASMFAWQRMEGSVKEIIEVKKKITQKLLIAATVVELQYEKKLCSEHFICADSYECTEALNQVLSQLNNVTNEKAKEFVKYFYEVLPTTNFYEKISDITGYEFKSILHDMAYAQNIPTKNVLGIVQKTVEDRVKSIASKFTNADPEVGRDVRLVHVILSDMDHFYRKQKKNPFQEYLKEFFTWAKEGGSVYSAPLRHAMKDIQNVLASKPDELKNKLVNEVRVFMEITVDPEP